MRVLFVCLGNICRSPTAHAVFDKLAHDEQLDVEIDSAGTAAYHVGEPPDPRSQSAGLRRGYDLSAQRARAVSDADFEHYDLILAMDEANLAALRSRCPARYQDRVKLFMAFAPGSSVQAVPDPYYGGPDGFDHVIDLVEAASAGLLREVRSRQT